MLNRFLILLQVDSMYLDVLDMLSKRREDDELLTPYGIEMGLRMRQEERASGARSSVKATGAVQSGQEPDKLWPDGTWLCGLCGHINCCWNADLSEERERALCRCGKPSSCNVAMRAGGG